MHYDAIQTSAVSDWVFLEGNRGRFKDVVVPQDHARFRDGAVNGVFLFSGHRVDQGHRIVFLKGASR